MTKTITVVRPHGSNYTPRELLIQYAKEHEPSVRFDYGFTSYLIIRGRRWAYDHWFVETFTLRGEQYDRIGITLVDVT